MMKRHFAFSIFYLATLFSYSQCISQNGDCPPEGGGTSIGGGISGGTGSGTGSFSAPIALQETNRGTTHFTANWSSVSGATSYRIDVSTSSTFSSYVSGYQNRLVGNSSIGGDPFLEGPDGGIEPIIVVAGLTPGRNYYYRVRAVNSTQTSSNSNTITANTSISAPSKIEESNRATTSFTARWGSVSGAQSYRLGVSTSSSFSSMLSGYNNKSVSGTSSNVTGLTPGKNYYYRVRAVGQHHTSSNSSPVTANTSIATPSKIEESNRTITSFTAKWGSVSGAQSYRLDVSTSSDFSNKLSGYNNLNVGSSTSRSVTGLTPGKNYYYRVRAVGQHHTSSNSSPVTANTSIATPSKIEESNRTITSFTAKWGSVSGAQSYRLDVSTSSDFSNKLSGYNNLNVGSSTSRSVTGLTPGKNYYYRVRAVGQHHTSSNSSTVTANTSIASPAQIEESNRTTTSFIARWGSVSGAQSYRLDVSLSSDFGNMLSGYNNLNVGISTNRTIAGLTPGRNYFYRVRAVGANVVSSSSLPIIANTIINLPVAAEETNKQTTSFVANWSVVNGAATYEIQVSKSSNFSTILKEQTSTSNSVTIIGLNLNSNHYYRVRALGQPSLLPVGSQPLETISSPYSSPITVHAIVSPGTISYSGGVVCAGSSAPTINGTSASGGTGSYEYQWQYYNGSSWQTLSNSNQKNFDPSNVLTIDTRYRRRVRSDASWVASNEVTIPVYDVITNIGTLSMTSGQYCPGDGASFNFTRANSNVNLSNTVLEVLRKGVWVNLGNITGTRSVQVTTGDVLRVRYDQLCSSGVYSNTITPSLRTDCIEPPSLDQNFVRVEIPRVPISDPNAFNTLNTVEKNVSYSYSDGAGRPILTIGSSAGQDGEDVVHHHVYDSEGRQSTTYMPYAKSALSPGEYRINPTTEQASFYSDEANIAHDANPYSINDYDNYGRVKSIVAPGEAWHSADKKTVVNYFMYEASMNGTVHELKRWVLGTNDKPRTESVYSSNQLTISEVISPDGRKMQTITNGLGQKVASRKWDVTSWNTTYQVYDEYARLRFVIPPKVADKTSLSDAEIDGFLFEQRYDDRGRVIESRSPGAGWNYIVYDQWNRPVMMRHDGQKDNAGNTTWTFIKYDIFGRSIMRGVLVSSKIRSELQSMISGGRYEDVQSNAIGYTLNQSFPDLSTPNFDDYELHTISYYDNYEFLNYSGWDAESHDFSSIMPAGFIQESIVPDGYTLLTSDHTITQAEANGKFAYQPGVRVTIPAGVRLGSGFKLIIAKSNSSAVLGMATGAKVRVLGTDKWLNSVVYYDDKLREIQLITENHLSGTDRLSYELAWEGQVLQSMLEHKGTDNVTVLSEYEYDLRGQHLRTYETIDGVNRTLVAEYSYNVLGQLMEKNIHSSDNGGSFLQSVDYRYNIRGWISSINNTKLDDGESDLFGQELNYTNSVTINGQAIAPNYDGNITSTVWNSDNSPLEGGTGGVSGESIYGYTYSALNQLSVASYAVKNGSTWNGDPEMYGMTAGYDANGSTEQLTRNGADGVLDDLDYTYEASSNKLTAVADNSSNTEGMEDYYPGTDYAYDEMGNRTSDLNKQITAIKYNHLQLVDEIIFYDNTSIKYVYDAGGNRLSKTIVGGSGQEISKVDYVGAVEYLDEEINQVFIEGGRAYKQSGQYFNEYFITDNQGNNRVAFGVLPERNIYTATMEQERSSYEESEFSFPSNIRSTNRNHTPLGSESVALNGALMGKEVGPAKVLTIQPGDEVDVQVWARYDFNNWNNTSVGDIAGIVSSAFGGASAGTGGESASSALNNALGSPAAAGLFSGSTSGEPEAYLQYLFFDVSYSYVPEGSGFIAVGSDAEGAFAELASGKLTYDEPGYLFVYVANESNQDAYVYFDDLKITHSSANATFKVSQVNEYYPYGLHTDKSWRAAGYVDPGLMYQASYAGYDSLTGYYDFLFRSYDPALGQFFAVDPMAVTQTGYSPYHANYNNPIMFIDPTGLAPDYPMHPRDADGKEPHLGSWINVRMGLSWGFQSSGSIGPGSGNHWSAQYRGSSNQSVINELTKSPFGGNWTPSGGFKFFASSLDAKNAGLAYNVANNSLSGTELGSLIDNSRKLAQNRLNGDFVQIGKDGKFYVPYTNFSYFDYTRIRSKMNSLPGGWFGMLTQAFKEFISSGTNKSYKLPISTPYGEIIKSGSVKLNTSSGKLADATKSADDGSWSFSPKIGFGSTSLSANIDLKNLSFSSAFKSGDISISNGLTTDGISTSVSRKFGDVTISDGLAFKPNGATKLLLGAGFAAAAVASAPAWAPAAGVVAAGVAGVFLSSYFLDPYYYY